MRQLDLTAHPGASRVVDTIAILLRSSDPREALEGLVGAWANKNGPRAYAEIHITGQSGRQYVVRRLRGDNGEDLLPAIAGGPAGSRSGGFIERLIREPLPRILHHLDLAGDPVLPPEMADYRSAMAMPLFVDQTARDWVALFDRQPDGFDSQELEELAVRMTLMATAMSNLQITRELFNANLRAQEELAAIASIQQALLPQELPEIPGLRLAASYETVGQAGGDLYDFVPLDHRPGYEPTQGDGRWAILIGDISGHGPAAAMVMAMLHSILHAFPHRPEGPAEVLNHLNRHLCAKSIGSVFATAFLAFFDPSRKTLRYARAGHNPPLLLTRQSDPAAVPLDAIGDIPLGIDPQATFRDAEIQLQAGQMLILYTDGIIEARSPDGRFFDLRGLQAAAMSSTGSARSTLATIRNAILRHSAGMPAGDDQTIVAAEIS